MSRPWFEAFRPLCDKVCAGGGYPHPVPVVLFYVARWCQKSTGEPEPTIPPSDEVESVAERIARNLSDDGEIVDRLFKGGAKELTDLRRLLLASARPRCGDEALEFADEALQKIALVLLTGTPPFRAEQQLAEGPEGPSNEYIFTSPFPHWARTVLINLIFDEHRRRTRERRRPPEAPKRIEPSTDDVLLRGALDGLPSLLEAVRALPRVQHSVMVISLRRRDVKNILWEHIQDLAPDLFGEDEPRPASDREVADLLGTTPRLVAASRSAARRKLVRSDPTWALMLDALLPHKSTRPAPEAGSDA